MTTHKQNQTRLNDAKNCTPKLNNLNKVSWHICSIITAVCIIWHSARHSPVQPASRPSPRKRNLLLHVLKQTEPGSVRFAGVNLLMGRKGRRKKRHESESDVKEWKFDTISTLTRPGTNAMNDAGGTAAPADCPTCLVTGSLGEPGLP